MFYRLLCAARGGTRIVLGNKEVNMVLLRRKKVLVFYLGEDGSEYCTFSIQVMV